MPKHWDSNGKTKGLMLELEHTRTHTHTHIVGRTVSENCTDTSIGRHGGEEGPGF